MTILHTVIRHNYILKFTDFESVLISNQLDFFLMCRIKFQLRNYSSLSPRSRALVLGKLTLWDNRLLTFTLANLTESIGGGLVPSHFHFNLEIIKSLAIQHRFVVNNSIAPKEQSMRINYSWLEATIYLLG